VCKGNCPVYNKHWTSFIDINAVSGRELQPELRQMVFERDEYTCQRCGQVGGKLNSHHIDPVKNNPIESADVDNCITFCIDCHKLAHKDDGCKYSDLAKC